MNTRDKIIDKIEKLLRHTNDSGASENEVRVAMKIAEKLMAKYEVEMAEVMAAKGETLQLDSVTEQVVREHSKTDKHELLILNAVIKITNTAAYIKSVMRDGKLKKQMIVYGHEDDVAFAHRMFTELIILVRSFARIKVPGKWRQQHYWYCKGFGQGLYNHACEIEEQREAEKAARAAATNALILRKDELIKEYELTLNLRVRKGGRDSNAARNSAEFSSGYSDGKKYQFGEKLK